MKLAMTALLFGFVVWGSPLCGDVIYLKNGNVLVVEKACWEKDQVKYRVATGIQTISRDSVRRVQAQTVIPADPSRGKPAEAVVIRGTPSESAPSANTGKALASKQTSVREAARSSRFRDAAGYAEAVRLQQANGTPIALYFYVDWCGYCAQLERDILSHSEVKQFLENFLYVSVNPEHGNAEEKLFASFEGTGFPTFLILSKKHAREVSTAGPAAAFIQACKKAAGGQ